MAVRIPSLVAGVELDLKGFEAQMRQVPAVLGKASKQVATFGSRAATSLKAAGQAAARYGPLIGLAVTGAATSALRAADAQEKAVAKVANGIRSTAGAAGLALRELEEEASRLQGVSLFGDEQILADATAQLLTFTNIAGEQFKRTQAVALDLATKLDGDLKSASIQLGKALNDPVANLSALSRSGIQFSKDQQSVIKSLAESGRLAEAQSVILGELERQYGGTAKAAAEAGLGPLQQLGNTLGDINEELGQAILESGLLTRFKEGVESLVQPMRDFIGVLGEFATAWANDFANPLRDMPSLMRLVKEQLLLGGLSILEFVALFPGAAAGVAVAREKILSELRALKTGTMDLLRAGNFDFFALTEGVRSAVVEGTQGKIPVRLDPEIDEAEFDRMVSDLLVGSIPKLSARGIVPTTAPTARARRDGPAAADLQRTVDALNQAQFEEANVAVAQLAEGVSGALTDSFQGLGFAVEASVAGILKGVKSVDDALQDLKMSALDILGSVLGQLVKFGLFRGLTGIFGGASFFGPALGFTVPQASIAPAVPEERITPIVDFDGFHAKYTAWRINTGN